MKILLVTKHYAHTKQQKVLTDYMVKAGFDADDLYFDSVVGKDFPYEAKITREDIKFARERLSDTIPTAMIDGVVSFGNEALTATQGHSGITKWRGQVEERNGVKYLGTIAPAAVTRNPSQGLGFEADLKFFYNNLMGVELDGDQPTRSAEYNRITCKRELVDALTYIRAADAVSFDIETKSFDEFEPDAFVVSIAVTTLRSGHMRCWAFPLSHRASVFQSSWVRVLGHVVAAINAVPVRIGHNAKFDCRWLVQFTEGVSCNFDTMLAAHVLDENRVKGLKPLARSLLGAAKWDIDIKSGKNAPPWYTQSTLKDILWYNGVDTWQTMRLYKLFRAQLDEQPRLDAIMRHLMMPASQSLVHIERAGVFVDREALNAGAEVVANELDRIDRALMRHVPKERREGANFNPSNFLKWFLYEHLDLPVLQRTDSGEPSTAEGVLSKLVDDHPAVALLLERVKWNKFKSSFFNPYQELITHDDRIRTTFKPHGTVTGRLSSGKGDADKVTGARASSMRGVNLQQVPRDPLVRSLFGAGPGWTFIEADYSQVELRIAADIAQEPTMLTLYATGQDIHMTMAMRMTGKAQGDVTSEERKKAKAVNFGFLYGMGWKKFIETAWNNYGVVVTEVEAQAFRRAFFDEFPMLVRWHARQRRLVKMYGRVESPIGRVRHLPDITSPDEGVRAEAQRQSINSPVQAYASDLCLLSMCLIDRRFRKLGMKSHPIGTVHDAINFEILDDELEQAIPIIKHTMENPPLERLFGVSLKVPLVADMKVGTRWGTGKEL